jgi:tetratricopeptide (TPR) repeat protein
MPYRLYRIIVCVLVALLLLSFALPAAAQEQESQLAEANRLNQQVIQLYQAGHVAEAVPLAQRVLAIDEKALGPDHPNVATALGNLASLYQAKGDYERAEPLYQRALAIYAKALGAEHPAVATSLNNLALLYTAKGDYGRAIKQMEEWARSEV